MLVTNSVSNDEIMLSWNGFYLAQATWNMGPDLKSILFHNLIPFLQNLDWKWNISGSIDKPTGIFYAIIKWGMCGISCQVVT